MSISSTAHHHPGISQVSGSSGASRRRNTVSVVLAVVSVLAMVLSVVGVWAARTALNTDVFVSRVGPLVTEPEVAESLSVYLTDEVIQTLDVEGFLAASLPGDAAVLARPLTGAVTAFVRTQVAAIIESDAFETVWARVLTGAHDALTDVVDDTNTIVTTGDGTIDINLLPAVAAVITQLAGASPELTSRVVTVLDNLENDPPPEAIAAIEQATGVSLPANFGVVTIDDGGGLAQVRTLVKLARAAVVALMMLAVAATVGTVVAAPVRKRRVAQLLGAWAVAVALVRQATLWVADRLAGTVRNPTDRAAAEAIVDALVQGLIVACAIVLLAVISAAVALWAVGRAAPLSALMRRQPTGDPSERWWLPAPTAVWPTVAVVATTTVMWLVDGSLVVAVGLAVALVVALVVMWANERTPAVGLPA